MITKALFSRLSGSGASARLSIVAFHKVPATADPLTPSELCLQHFEQILRFLTRYFKIVPLADAIAHLQRHTLHERAVAITFNDGYADWHSGVVPLLRKYDAPATFFVVTDQLRGSALWHERVIAAVRALPLDAWLPEGVTVKRDVHGGINTAALVATLQDFLKYCRLSDREALIERLEVQASSTLQVARPFGASDIMDLHRQGFDIGSHTVSHPTLTMCSAAEAREQIGRSREELQALIRAPVTLFAYPNGAPQVDFTEEHVQLVRKSGYLAAVTTHRAVATVATSPLLLPRFTPWARGEWRIGMQLARNLLRRANTGMGERNI